jgi:hypothetical protein
MQIFEITQRRPVNEISWAATKDKVAAVKDNYAAATPAALSRGVATGTGFAGALGRAITNAPLNALGGRTGADLTPDRDAVGWFGKTRESIANRMDAAVKAAMPVITQQAAQQWNMWQASVADMVKKAGVQNISQIDPQQLREPLMKQIETIASKYGIRDYRKLPNYVDADAFGGAAKYEALDTVKAIDAAIAAILDPKQQVGTEARDNWVNLTKELYSAGLQLKFREEDNKFTARDLATDADAIEKQEQKAKNSGLHASQQRIPDNVVRPTGNPDVDAYMQSIGLLPKATVRTPAPAPVTAESAKKRSK